MSLVIRFTRTGKRGERKFRVVVKEKRSRRDGDPVEMLGYVEKTTKGITKELNTDRINYWIKNGAQVSPAVKELL
jgi:small subunit ribosomal protein S16